MPYESTPNKECIRRVWDAPILLALAQSKNSGGLLYFGLTGPEMHDVLDWKDVLSPEVTSVEEDGPAYDDILSRIVTVSAQNDLRTVVLHGKVEDVITDGYDLDDTPPPEAYTSDGQLYFRYDVVNLDFDGGVGNRLLRLRAIARLLERQSQSEFILFVTFNVRSALQAAITQELDNLEQQVDPQRVEAVRWYRTQPELLRVKAVVPGIIAHHAATANLDCLPYAPIIYEGAHRAKLVHFAFQLTPRSGAFRGHTPSAGDLVTLPILEAKDGSLIISRSQAPGFSLEACVQMLDFLGADRIQELRAQYDR